MSPKTHHTRYFDVIVGDDIVTLRRTIEPFDLQGLLEACTPVFELLRPLKHLGLVVDVRGVVGRADPEFETAFSPIRKRLLQGHPRVATLVATAVGRLQMTREATEDRRPLVQQVFLDENDALRFAIGN